MKHLMMLITALILAASTVMADQAKSSTSAQMPMAEKTVSGKVKAVSMADAAKGTKSEIVLTNEGGADVNFLVTATTTLYDADAKALTLDKIVSGSKLNVVYMITAEGVKEAKSVKIVK